MNAQMRRWVYLLTGLVAALIPIGVQVGIFDTGQEDSVNTLLVSVASLFGAGGAVTAAHHVNKQNKAGMHDPPLNPLDQMQASATQIVEQANQAQINLDRLREISGSLATPQGIPVVPEAGSLADQVLNQVLPQ